MGKGRPPKPAIQKLLEGDKTKRGIPEHEPQPLAGYPDPPADLKPDALAVWDSLRRSIESCGHITQVDQWSLATLCKAIARQLKCEEEIEKEGSVIVVNGFPQRNPWEITREKAVQECERLMTRLSLSPLDRAKLGLTLMQASKEFKQNNNPLNEFIDA
jgi:P27 family predicted phage terminase small subunit